MSLIKRIFIPLLLSLVISCGPSVKGEQKKWDKNVSKIQAFEVRYPVYKELLENELATATDEFNKAVSIEDKKAKVEAMVMANGFLKQGVIGALYAVDSKINSIQSKIHSLGSARKNESETFAASNAANEASQKIADVKIRLADPIADIDEAKTSLNQMNVILSGAEAKVDKVLTTVRNRLKAEEEIARKKKEAEANKTQAPAAINKSKPSVEKKAPAQASGWKCKYCGRGNSSGAVKCGGCGAAKTVKK